MNKIVKKALIIIIISCFVIALKSGFKVLVNKIYTSNYPEKITSFPLQINSFLNIYEPYIVHYNYGNYYYKKELYDKAYEEYLKALNYRVPQNRICLIKYNISLSLVKLSENETGNEKKELLEKADNYLQECINMERTYRSSYSLVKLLFVLIITFSCMMIIMVIVGRKNGKLIPSLNREYLKRLDILLNEVKEEEIDNRDAYKEMSLIIREFIAKETKINVLSLSKEEINKLNIKDLSALMDEYYKNEFSRTSKGDIIESINKTMEVIRTWNWK